MPGHAHGMNVAAAQTAAFRLLFSGVSSNSSISMKPVTSFSGSSNNHANGTLSCLKTSAVAFDQFTGHRQVVHHETTCHPCLAA
eukprot:877678-Rhodomonas_salina.1